MIKTYLKQHEEVFMKKEKEDKAKKRKLKYLNEDTVAKMEKKSTEELLKDARQLGKNLVSLKRQKKDDPKLNEYKKKLEAHYEKNKQEELAELEQIKHKTKEIRESMKVGAEEILENQKERNNDFREDMAPIKEQLRIIDNIIDERN